MSLSSFTSNHADRSTQAGYQFEFYCDRCGQGHRSTFSPSKSNLATGLLRAAGSMFGGKLGQIAYAGDQLKDALRGPAWDSAFRDAVEAGKRTFRQCPQCRKWVCPERCWNSSAECCTACAQAVPAGAPGVQGAAPAATCPGCGAPATGGKFCAECGKPLPTARTNCPKCNGKVEPAAKFCPECGEKLA